MFKERGKKRKLQCIAAKYVMWAFAWKIALNCITRRSITEVMTIKNKSNENFKTTIASKNYHRPKTTGECGNLLNIWVAF